MHPTKRDVEKDYACKCERCSHIIWQDEAYFIEYYIDATFTDIIEDEILCKECAKKYMTQAEFEYGCRKESAYK